MSLFVRSSEGICLPFTHIDNFRPTRPGKDKSAPRHKGSRGRMGAVGRQHKYNHWWRMAFSYLPPITYRKVKHMNNNVSRGDIFLADLNPVIGSEQGGLRPVLVIQNDTGNKHSTTVIVAPITGRQKPHIPTHVLLSSVSEIRPGSIALLEQLRTIDMLRFIKKIGAVDASEMKDIDEALLVSLGIEDARKNISTMSLCSKCVQYYRDTEEYIVRRLDRDQEIKESCTFCGSGLGFDYEVIRR